MTDIAVRRVDFGYFVRPGSETADGVERVEPVLGYLVDHPDGAILVDTGMGRVPGVDDHYRPHRIPLRAALRAVGAAVEEIRLVVNCHLHFDHCGGNAELAGVPVLAQRAELAVARESPQYAAGLFDHPGAVIEELDGDAEIRPGVLIVPTAGHTDGHQSVVVASADGTVIVAGQSHDQAAGFTGDVLGRRAGVGAQPAWLGRLLDLDPRRVLFAHDNAVWEP
ncbi:MBL fold metallo-hydrolase [Actinoplanes sp. NPDC051851]|uniref:MBL fold metallo-hydrolase n=1 Tax=Actinoplanes sp. NPDC051851 TaxID=3154753 RepID=UPI003433541A